MNVSERLFESMMRVSPEDAKALTLDEMESLGVGLFDPVYTEARENKRAVKLGMTKQQFLTKKRETADECGRIDIIINQGDTRNDCWKRKFPGYFGE